MRPCRGLARCSLSLFNLHIGVSLAAIIAGTSIFISRLLGIYYNISLPRFRFKS